MPEYIEREAAIKFVKEQMEEVNNKTAINGSYVTKTYDMAIRHATKLLRYVPTAYPESDVVEVVRGRWIKRQFADEPTAFGYRCSECHLTYELDTNYCPNCGARMDGATDTNVGGKLTNLERIKSMSVNELSELLESTSNDLAIKLFGSYITRDKEYIQAWLESEVEDND